MKNKKLFAILTLVCFMFTLMPVAAFAADAAQQVEKGNKAAGTRARKASLELEKLMKEFRKASLEAAK